MEWLRKAIIGAGGFAKVAADTGISVPHLYAVCRGYRALTPSVVARLRPALPRVGKARWSEAVLGSAILSGVDNPASGGGKAAPVTEAQA